MNTNSKWFALIAAVILLSACGTQMGQPTEPSSVPQSAGTLITLPFVEVAQGAAPGDSPTDALYTVITAPAQWEQVSTLLPQQALTEARSSMQQEPAQWLIVAYGGVKNTGGYTVTIQRIERYTDRMVVTIAQAAPREGDAVTQAFTQPYHIVALRKADDAGLTPQLVIFSDETGAELARLNMTP
jgi:hypothetical protein